MKTCYWAQFVLPAQLPGPTDSLGMRSAEAAEFIALAETLTQLDKIPERWSAAPPDETAASISDKPGPGGFGRREI